MYRRIVRDLKSNYPDFPDEPSLELGLAIKHIRLRMGMTQDELATLAKIKPAALKTLENGYAKFTKTSVLQSIAGVLRIDLREIILEAREWFPANFFALRLGESDIASKPRPGSWNEAGFKKIPLRYDAFTVELPTPPITSASHFCFALLEIKPGMTAGHFQLDHSGQVLGFVQRGALGVLYNSREESIFANQGFCLRGDKPHDLINKDKDNPLRLCLAFSLANPQVIARTAKSPDATGVEASPTLGTTARNDLKGEQKKSAGTISIGDAIKRIRYLYSNAQTRPLTFAELSRLTGLEEKSLQYLENTTRPEQVVYWDKIEKITQALKMPLRRFYDLAEGKDTGYFYLATAHDRALIDYRHYLGVRIKSALFPSASNQFHISEMYIEPQGGIRRSTWKRADDARIAAVVEDGELLVEVGKNRKVNLKQGESVYFDASLGYKFTNTNLNPTKLLVAACPPIIF